MGFVDANGGVMSKYSAGIYSTQPSSFAVWSDAGAQATLDSVDGSLAGTVVGRPSPSTTATAIILVRK